MQTGKFFNVRVYAILINSKRELLISDEFHYNTNMRKFPGGGLQFGEGIINCLQRELKEELDIEVSNINHFHTTEVFSQSAFDANHQVIGVYYLVELLIRFSISIHLTQVCPQSMELKYLNGFQ